MSTLFHNILRAAASAMEIPVVICLLLLAFSVFSLGWWLAELLRERGEVYYDARTGTYYIVPNAAGNCPMEKLMAGRTYRRRFLLLGGVCLLLLLASMLVGRYGLSAGKLLHMLWTRLTGGAADWSVSDEKVVFAIRLPRIAAAALVGAALAVSGTAYQGMFRNPMVSPDILGASTGAGFGAALAILLGAGYFGISLSAFCFGLLAVAAAWLVSRLSHSDPTVALILAGMMISSLFSAGTSFIKLVADTQQQLPAITYWLMGSLSSIKAEDVRFLVLPVAVGLLPLFLLRWRMNLLTVGEEEAQSMGVRTGALRLVVILCATLLTAASVAVSGMIGWVGLVIPHFCRMLFGYDYRRLIPAAALFGVAFLLAVDDIARLVTTGELPLGILTAFVGAPLFLYLIITGGRRHEH